MPLHGKMGGGKMGGGKKKQPKVIGLNELNSPFFSSLTESIDQQPIQLEPTQNLLQSSLQGPAEQPQQQDRTEVTNPLLDQMIKHFSTDRTETADGELGQYLQEEGY